jgi:V8-like Glu-specific endopeptidase
MTMNKSRFFFSWLVGGLVACGGTVEDPGYDEQGHLGVTESQVIVGSVDWSSATSLTGAKAQRAQAVGYLSIPAKNSRCTAWLASEDIVITNNHCIATASEAAGARVSFNYNEGVSSSSRVWYDCSTFVKTWANLDMTALRCAPLNNQLPGQTHGYLRVASADAATNSSIYVIHQNCDYYTDSSCTPTKKHSPGSILNASYSSTDASYNADTLGGSSGSPVLAENSHEVVALHHYGFNQDSMGRGTHNSGVRAGHIRTALLDINIGCPVYPGTMCYWMGFHDTGTWDAWCWEPATWVSTFAQCYEMDSCDGGLGYSGGGCYKWASSSEAPRTPW